MQDETNTNLLLVQWQGGEDDARDRLVARLHPVLSQIAPARLRREQNSSLSSGDLINDAVVRLIQSDSHSLVEHARQKASAKRNHVKVELCTNMESGQRFDLKTLNSALIMGAIDAKLMELVEMRYFGGGMTVTDVATVTGLSEPTVRRRRHVACLRLSNALANPIEND